MVYPSEAYAEWKDTIEAAPELMYGEILQRFRGGKDVLASEYLKAMRDLKSSKSNMPRNVRSLMGHIANLSHYATKFGEIGIR